MFLREYQIYHIVIIISAENSALEKNLSLLVWISLKLIYEC